MPVLYRAGKPNVCRLFFVAVLPCLVVEVFDLFVTPCVAGEPCGAFEGVRCTDNRHRHTALMRQISRRPRWFLVISRMRAFCDSMALLVAGTGVTAPSARSMNVNMAVHGCASAACRKP